MKKLLAIILSLSLVVALSACTTGDPSSSSTSSSTSSASTSSEGTSSDATSSDATSSDATSSGANGSSTSSTASGTSSNPGTGTNYDQWAYEVAAGLGVDVDQVQGVISLFDSKMAAEKIDANFYETIGLTSAQVKEQYKTFEEFATAVTALADAQVKK